MAPKVLYICDVICPDPKLPSPKSHCHSTILSVLSPKKVISLFRHAEVALALKSTSGCSKTDTAFDTTSEQPISSVKEKVTTKIPAVL